MPPIINKMTSRTLSIIHALVCSESDLLQQQQQGKIQIVSTLAKRIIHSIPLNFLTKKLSLYLL